MTTTLNVSAVPIHPFEPGGNALQMGPIKMQGIVGSQGPGSLINRNPAWQMQSSASIDPSTGARELFLLRFTKAYGTRAQII
jgi:hypothetical protein